MIVEVGSTAKSSVVLVLVVVVVVVVAVVVVVVAVVVVVLKSDTFSPGGVLDSYSSPYRNSSTTSDMIRRSMWEW